MTLTAEQLVAVRELYTRTCQACEALCTAQLLRLARADQRRLERAYEQVALVRDGALAALNEHAKARR